MTRSLIVGCLGLLAMIAVAGCGSADTKSEQDSSSVNATGSTENDPSETADKQPEQKQAAGSSEKKMGVTKAAFGKTKDGKEVDLYTCTNANGLVMSLTNYGAIVTSLETPDRDGKLANITLGFDKLDGYLARHPYFGATVGRYCNRIAKGKFKLADKEYTLATNNDANHLHGGEVGFDKVVWQAAEVTTDSSVGVKFTYVSKDGEEG